jgi:serine/threonine protein kinase
MSVEETIRGRSGLSPGSEFAGFRVERTLGHGGMGIIYLAREVRLDRDVALKVIRTELAEDERFRARFREESRIAASIEHPRVVTVFGAGERDGLIFVSMRYVPGRDLGRLISARGRLSPEEAAPLIAQVADGLDAVHEAGLVHRDVKPANVLVGEPGTGDPPVAFLTDFGLAKVAASTSGLTATGEVIGTVDYMAPEQIEGRRVDARTDVYALGCVLFHAITGDVPFPERESSAKMWAHLNEPPPAVGSGKRAVLDRVIRRAMAKDPADRFPSAGDLGRAAVAATRGEAVTEPEHPVGVGEAAPAAETIPLEVTRPTERLPRRRRRKPRRLRRILIPLLALLVAAAITVAALIAVPKLTDSDNPAPRPTGITVPSLVGQPLDVAERRLDDLGLNSTEEGGGIFGVLIAPDWEVCATSPSAGSTVRRGATVRLAIDRPGAC